MICTLMQAFIHQGPGLSAKFEVDSRRSLSANKNLKSGMQWHLDLTPRAAERFGNSPLSHRFRDATIREVSCNSSYSISEENQLLTLL